VKPKVLLYDIETSPNLAYVWGKYDQNVIAYEEEWEILSVAWKWLGQKRIHCVTQKDNSELGLCSWIWELFDTADVVIAHNGDKFDQKKVKARMLIHGLKPPSPFASVDTLKIARKHFKFNSNKLDDLGRQLGVGRKLKHPGFDLWLGCMKGDAKSWSMMEKYNKQDVVLLEKVYKKLLPWIDNHPSMALLQDREGCPSCGSKQVQKRGKLVTHKSVFQRYQCQKCGGWFKGRYDSEND